MAQKGRKDTKKNGAKKRKGAAPETESTVSAPAEEPAETPETIEPETESAEMRVRKSRRRTTRTRIPETSNPLPSRPVPIRVCAR